MCINTLEHCRRITELCSIEIKIIFALIFYLKLTCSECSNHFFLKLPCSVQKKTAHCFFRTFGICIMSFWLWSSSWNIEGYITHLHYHPLPTPNTNVTFQFCTLQLSLNHLYKNFKAWLMMNGFIVSSSTGSH